MKTILNKIEIHLFTYVFLLLALFTGLIKELLIFMFILIVHELGHILAALLFKWKIYKIKIMPFGLITIFEEYINRPMIEEFIILVMGPFFQLFNFIIFKDITPYFKYYNYGLFIFNMLPIYPLDGYKLFNIILNRVIPYKKTLRFSLIISILCLTLFIRKDLIYLVILLLLLKGIIKEYHNIDFTYNKFLLERYTHTFKFKKRKIIKSISKMYRDCLHLIMEDNNLITEKEALEKRFSK